MTVIKAQPVLVASHPRSGTHLAIDTIRRHFPSARSWRWWGLPLDHLYLNLERLAADRRRFEPALARRILERPHRALLKTHFTADFAESWAPEESQPPPEPFQSIAAQARVLYVVRHPLDVMASYKQFLAALHAEIAGQSLADFVAAPHWSGSTDRLGWWIEHVTGWSRRPLVYVLRYEDLIRQPTRVVGEIADWLQETPRQRRAPLPPKIKTLRRTRLDRLLSLAPASTAIVADPRLPKPDWRAELEPKALAKIAERLEQTIGPLGYDLDLVDQAGVAA